MYTFDLLQHYTIQLSRCVRERDRDQSERMMGRSAKMAQAGSKNMPLHTLY